MTTIGAVVVHHANFPGVLRTVTQIIAQGVPAHQLVVVDNSEDVLLAAALRKALPSDSLLEVTTNKGYGHAANLGAGSLLKLYPPLDYILVSSHETLPAPGAIPALEHALAADSTLGVVGPTLISESRASGSRVYWSQGGVLTRLLNEPRHVAHLAPVGEMPSGPVVRRAWLDGAFCLYRAAVLSRLRFRCDFFLYFEETDLHMRMQKAGYAAGWVPGACVEQSSNGAPPFLLGRNLQLFQHGHGTTMQRAWSVPAVILRRTARRLLGRGTPGEVSEILRGWVSAL